MVGALRESDERYRRPIEGMPLCILTFDRDGIVFA
jgi:hypothetical protein